jgi:sialate O-acetylesterase
MWASLQYKSMTIKGNQVVLSFDHLGGGLKFKDEELYGFTIAGADKNFIKGKAVIQKDKIIVSSDSISNPIAVRYGWAPAPQVNLFNNQGLPAAPFRTDQ